MSSYANDFLILGSLFACRPLAFVRTPGRASAPPTQDYEVVVDLPNPLPVTEAELELLEAELADFIAELLKK